jgi:hypothetical protein
LSRESPIRMSISEPFSNRGQRRVVTAALLPVADQRGEIAHARLLCGTGKNVALLKGIRVEIVEFARVFGAEVELPTVGADHRAPRPGLQPPQLIGRRAGRFPVLFDEDVVTFQRLVCTGLKEAIGSWKIMAISAPRMRRISAPSCGWRNISSIACLQVDMADSAPFCSRSLSCGGQLSPGRDA